MSNRKFREVEVVFIPATRPRNLRQLLFLICEFPVASIVMLGDLFTLWLRDLKATLRERDIV